MAAKMTDVITLIGVLNGGTNGLTNDFIKINSPITSGTTNSQGTNKAYFNTTTGKYEVYTSVTPQSGNQIIVSLNGLVLAPNIDYYQSVSEPTRIILNSIIGLNDVINIYYYAMTNYIGSLFTNNLNVGFKISIPPQMANGTFTVQVSTGTSFSALTASAITTYEIGKTSYIIPITLGGMNGETLYYRVKNQKRYKTISGHIITTTAYSETIPIIIMDNSINSY